MCICDISTLLDVLCALLICVSDCFYFHFPSKMHNLAGIQIQHGVAKMVNSSNNRHDHKPAMANRT